jgi:hypothetical protein
MSPTSVAPPRDGCPRLPSTGMSQPASKPNADSSDPARHNWLGIASAILGVVGLLTSWTVGIGIGFGIAAVGTGLVAWVRRGKTRQAPIAVAGIALGAVSIMLGVAAFGFWHWLSNEQMIHYHQCLVNGVYRHC